MNISNRLKNITEGGSDGWEIHYRAQDMKRAGCAVVELTLGEHDTPTDPAILKSFYHSAQGGNVGYAPVAGTDELRKLVAERIQKQTGTKTDRDNVIIVPGAQFALFAAHLGVCDPGDCALFIDPYYATYPGTLRATGCLAQPIKALPQNNFQPTREDIAPFAGKAKSLLINSPNNPTGAVYSQKTLDAIMSVCFDNDLWLISDEVYDAHVWAGSKHISPRTCADMQERTLVIGSMSKSHAMTGSRVGWIVGNKEIIADFINLATHATYGIPGFLQDGATFALQQGKALEERVSAPFRRRRALSLDILAGQNVVKAVPPEGAMYLMLDIRASGLSGEAFASRLLETHKIATMPGESFGEAGAGHIRIAMTVQDDIYKKSLLTICDFARKFVAKDRG